MNSQTRSSASAKPCGRVGVTIFGALACAIIVLGASFSSAQEDPARTRAGVAAWQKGACSDCHGTFGEGGAGGVNPAGPSLRTTKLEEKALADTIRCGRPGTAMPYHLRGAYVQTACYALPVGQVPAGLDRGTLLSNEETELLVGFLMARVVRKGAITREECGLQMGDPAHPSCSRYR